MGSVTLRKNDQDDLIGEIADAIGGMADMYGVILPAGLRGAIACDVVNHIIKPFLEEMTDANHVLRRDLQRTHRPHHVPAVRPE